MNRRKVLGILLLALITAFVAVSCSGNIEAPASSAEELSYVTFGNGHSRELGTSYLTEDYDYLYWFYTATKTDAYGTTGSEGLTDGVPTAAVSKSGDNPAKGLSGRVGPFSQGSWTFKLYAYAEAVDSEGAGLGTPDKTNLIYASDDVSVILKGGEVKNIPVSVSTQGETGTIKVEDVYFAWYSNDNAELGPIGQGGGTSKPSIKFELKNTSGTNIAPATISFGDYTDGKFYVPDATYQNISIGYYTAKVSVYLNGTATDGTPIDNEGTPLYTQTFGVRVYGNAITYISGDMIEGVTTYVTFDVPDQAMRVFTVNADTSTIVTANVTALNGNKESSGASAEENQKTTVTFPSGALDSSAVHQLDVAVTPIASAEQKFQVSGKIDGQAAVSGIDLTMVKVQKKDDGSTEQKPVDSFNGKTVKVTTYIATGLSDVKVKYLKSDGTYEDISSTYEAESGRLTFTTTHFSQYVVVAPVEALNVSTGVPYTSLASAIVSAGDGQEIQLTEDANITSAITVDKNLTLDLNGKDIHGTGTRIFNVTAGTLELTGTGSLISTGIVSGSSVIRVGSNNNLTVLKAGLIVGKDVTISGLESYGITVFGSKTMETVFINGTVSSYSGAVSGNGTSSYWGTTITINETASLSATNGPAIYHPQDGTLIINGGTMTGQTGVEVKGGTVIINDGTFASNYSGDLVVDNEPNSDGGNSLGYALSVVEKSGYAGKADVTVYGGTFNSPIVKGVSPEKPNIGKENELTVYGGTFSSDPSDYVATGYSANAKNSKYIVMASLPIDSEGTYIIQNENQLLLFEKLVNEAGYNFNGKTVKLTSDINLQGITWTPVGQTGVTQFMGTFDGNNKIIKNLTINNNDESANCATGLFGWLNSATVKNLKVEGASVSGHHNVGVIAGYLETSGCTIENCYVTNATLSCTSVNSEANGDKVGGIVGHAGNAGVVVKNCKVENSTISAGRDAGQVVGAALTANVTECSASNVTVTSNGTSTGANIRNEVIGRVL